MCLVTFGCLLNRYNLLLLSLSLLTVLEFHQRGFEIGHIRFYNFV